jgi:hypothetical protein
VTCYKEMPFQAVLIVTIIFCEIIYCLYYEEMSHFLQEHTQSCGGVSLRVFDRVVIQISIDQSNVQHLKLCLKLVKPEVSFLKYSHNKECFIFPFTLSSIIYQLHQWCNS